MGFFSRRKPISDQMEGDQSTATPLTALVLAALAERGVSATVREPHLIVDTEGRMFGLSNLEDRLSAVPRSDWPAEAQRFVGIVLEGMRAKPRQSVSELGESLLLRIVHPDLGHGESNEQVAKNGHALAAGLVVLPAVDHPDRVETLTDLSPLGGWEAVWPAGIANLLRLPTPNHQVVGEAGEPDRLVHLLISDDFFGASRLLVLEQVLSRVLGTPITAPHGTLIAVPNRHVLAVHVLSGAGLVAAMNELTRIAVQPVQGFGAPLSTNVYYRSPNGTLQQVASHDGQGRTIITVEGALQEAMESLNLLN